MSEPIKKPKTQPESFKPKRPEIVNMMNEAQAKKMHQIKKESTMEYRIEVKESFQIMGLSGYEDDNTKREGEVTGVWAPFTADYDKKLRDFYTAPYWQVGASDKKFVNGKTNTDFHQTSVLAVGQNAPCGGAGLPSANTVFEWNQYKLTIGAEYKGKMIEGMDIETIPAATYAVFPFDYPTGYTIYTESYAKILNNWFPSSGYKRDEDGMELEVYGDRWEIWIPVINN